jgi:hypothetical protein
MKKITSKSDFILYQQFINSLGNARTIYDEEIKKLPEYLQDIIKSDNAIFPSHLPTELIKEFLIEALKRIEPDYEIDKFSNPVINKITQYFSKDPEFITDKSLSFNKGILIMGGVGCGKSTLFRGINEMMKMFAYKDYYSSTHNDFRIHILDSFSFSQGFALKGFEIFDIGLMSKRGSMLHFMSAPLIIDDIGAESLVSHYGPTTNIIGEVLLRRYDGKSKTYCTTNLDRPKLKAFYGDRVYSRMIEMFNFLIDEGPDRRQ